MEQELVTIVPIITKVIMAANLFFIFIYTKSLMLYYIFWDIYIFLLDKISNYIISELHVRHDWVIASVVLGLTDTAPPVV